MPPVDLLALERGRIRSRINIDAPIGAPPIPHNRIKAEEQKKTVEQWHSRWRLTTKAPWTHQLILKVARWVGRTVPKFPLTYHMT